MPTPVDVARRCLAESAAAALDDAVAMARRRSHAQTTSLHIVSALLAPRSSVLREACSRTRGGGASSLRLQFRALELCVGVALDRVPVSKSAGGEPPVSNSLMAAINRSQGNQRRHYETLRFYQQHWSSDSQTPPSISAVRAEMKHFVMSILDDPIVSRVLRDAGFRTHEVKLAILNPFTLSRFASTACRLPSLFPDISSNFEPGVGFPFSQPVDEMSGRIAGILLENSRRNPLLVGAHASDAHRVFVDCLKKGGSGVLPREIDGLNIVSFDQEISGCSEADESLQEEIVRLKFKQVDEMMMMMDCRGPGIIVNCGDLKVFVDVGFVGVVRYIVYQLKRLMISHDRKLWLIGFLESDGDYKKLVELFPSIEMDLDLHVIPITTASNAENSFKSSFLMSFVPLGGFLSMPSKNEPLPTTAAKTWGLCNLCNEKYELEVPDVLKGVSTSSLAAKESRSLPSWLQVAESETSKKSLTAEVDTAQNQILQSWCEMFDKQALLSFQCRPKKTNPYWIPGLWHQRGNEVTSAGPVISFSRPVFSFSSHPGPQQSRPIFPSECENARANITGRGLELNNLHHSSDPQAKVGPPSNPLCSVTTNLRVGALRDSTDERTRKIDKTPCDLQISQYSPSCPNLLEKNMLPKDLKNAWTALADKVYWQSEAVQTISEVVSRCRSVNENGNVWLSLLGPDRVGKRKIASGVAEIVFGRKENLLSLDLNSLDVNSPEFTSVFDFYDSKHQRLKLGRKTIIDHLAEELSKHSHRVVLLENIDKADFLVLDSLCRAIKTGKFQNPLGKDIIINNNVFFLTSAVLKNSEAPILGKVTSDFPEHMILKARNLQMKILVASRDTIYRRNYTMSVSVTTNKISSKRKSSDHQLMREKISKRAIIDLNLPVEHTEEVNVEYFTNGDENGESDARLEELLENVDENVTFKPFDFDSLSWEILVDIDARLKKAFRPTVLLEIDREVMLQILAAAWLTDDGKKALGDWVENVLCLGLEEARQRCSVSRDVVMKLVHCDGCAVEARASGLCLPARINLD
ncbi:double Clp-N motif-containing P-loop nucleosidetriphosphate hydrolases superfamily protein [Striga asiatica]|uniref:Double Clp-N motif-containing P-loop nucleosidetriphosphate hydrolases superfamily protein n=1 Tax=Striga asiatica TaxID=4170 RepID=A0A5A7QZM7_STRAF|nr:double Clp-N motif-containing P-loop nucleosidetriphosphate hydrolases superfamily protein [Striga asiatica]